MDLDCTFCYLLFDILMSDQSYAAKEQRSTLAIFNASSWYFLGNFSQNGGDLDESIEIVSFLSK